MPAMFDNLVPEMLRLSLWLAGLALVFIPLERAFAVREAGIWRKGVGTDISLYFVNGIIPAILLSLPLSVAASAGHALVPSGVLQAIGEQPLWLRMAAGLVIGELGSYWGHRWSHEVPPLWRFHAVHHEAEHMDWLVNTRAHPVDMVFTKLCGLVPLYMLGLGSPHGAEDSIVPAVVLLVGSVWGYVIHSNLKVRFGPFEHLISSPAFHHWHHVRIGPINSNYASMLPWLDRLFGTLNLPPNQWPGSYGVADATPVATRTKPSQAMADKI